MNIAQRAWAALPAKPFVFGYLTLYTLTLTTLTLYTGFDPVEGLFVLLTLGLGFSTLAWLVTRSDVASRPEVTKPRAESLVLIVYLAVFAFGFLGWGLSFLKQALPDPRVHMVAVMAAKLVTMVVLPALILRGFGYPLRDVLRWNFTLKRRGLAFMVLATALLAFQLIFSQSLKQLNGLHLSAGTFLLGMPLCFLYLCVDTGLTEEYLFRVVIQTRLAAQFRSETAGVIVMSLLFGLAHAPGYYLRAADSISGGHPTMFMAVGYTVVMISVFGWLFGVLWARTRSLGLIVLVHAAADFLPNFADFIHTWMLGPA